MRDRTARRMLQLLEAEHAAITEGQFDALPELGAEKEALFTALAEAQLSKEVAQRLSDATRRNQALLQAAMRGVKAAEQTLQAMQTASKGGFVYGSDGTVSRLSKGDQRLSHKL